MVCTEYYEVTTHYDIVTGEILSQTSEYLYTTCICSSPNTVQSTILGPGDCDNSSGGNEGGEVCNYTTQDAQQLLSQIRHEKKFDFSGNHVGTEIDNNSGIITEKKLGNWSFLTVTFTPFPNKVTYSTFFEVYRYKNYNNDNWKFVADNFNAPKIIQTDMKKSSGAAPICFTTSISGTTEPSFTDQTRRFAKLKVTYTLKIEISCLFGSEIDTETDESVHPNFRADGVGWLF